MSRNKVGNLIGKKFGKLVVLEDLAKQKVLVRCECGEEKIVGKYDVYYGDTTTCGKCCIFNDISGKIFGRLTAVFRSDKRYKDGSALWQCICECGSITYVSYTRLIHNRCQSCGCKRNEDVSKRCSLPLKDSAYNYVYAQYKSNAKIRDIPFLLERNDFINIISQNCYYCGCAPSNTINRKNFNGEITLYYSGIDRIDSNKPYIVDNCVASCKRCNAAKSDMSHSDFISLIKIIASRF